MIQRRSSTAEQWTAAMVALGAVVIVAVMGNVATSDGQAWYERLERPDFTPPGWTFGAVWTPIYALIAASGWLLWVERAAPRGARRLALALWLVQLFLNLGWTWLFFGLQEPGLALAEIVLLEAVIVLTIIAAWRVNRLAAICLLPYVGWVAFATILNFEFWRLN